VNKPQKIHGRYFADGFLLEAALSLAEASDGHPGGRLLYDADRVVLFTALASEAHINHAIETGLSGAAMEAARKLPTKDKLKLVPGLAGVFDGIDPSREPLQSLFVLHKRRNELVHADPDVWEVRPKAHGQGMTIVIPRRLFGTPLSDAARWLLSLCQYLDKLARSGVGAWRDHAYLAQELLTQQEALKAWDTARHGPELHALATHLIDADFH
jgi:hypothetical protein